jgi:hypothetical protein
MCVRQKSFGVNGNVRVHNRIDRSKNPQRKEHPQPHWDGWTVLAASNRSKRNYQ